MSIQATVFKMAGQHVGFHKLVPTQSVGRHNSTLINIFTSKFGLLHILKEKYPSHLAVKCTTVFIHVKNETNNQSA